jgi:hypothetical protein
MLPHFIDFRINYVLNTLAKNARKNIREIDQTLYIIETKAHGLNDIILIRVEITPQHT